MSRVLSALLFWSVSLSAASMSINESAGGDPQRERLVQARAARFSTAWLAVLRQAPNFRLHSWNSVLPVELMQLAQTDERWGVSLAMLNGYVGDAEPPEVTAAARKWLQPSLQRLLADGDELEPEEVAQLLLEVLRAPRFGEQSSLVRSWIRPFYLELASRPFPQARPDQQPFKDGYSMVLAHMAELTLDFERMLVIGSVDGICELDSDEDQPSELCAPILVELQRRNSGRPLFDLAHADVAEHLGTLIDDGCQDHSDHARVMLLLLDAQDRAPLDSVQLGQLVRQVDSICPQEPSRINPAP